jgi:hypothetical protein
MCHFGKKVYDEKMKHSRTELGSEGTDFDLYIYGALYIEIPPDSEGARAVTGTKRTGRSPSVSSARRRQR